MAFRTTPLSLPAIQWTSQEVDVVSHPSSLVELASDEGEVEQVSRRPNDEGGRPPYWWTRPLIAGLALIVNVLRWLGVDPTR